MNNEHPICPNCGVPLAGGSPSVGELPVEPGGHGRTRGVAPGEAEHPAGGKPGAGETLRVAAHGWQPFFEELPPERRLFGDYELLEEIGRGGMGVIYKARQASLNRMVALKMIVSGQLAGEEELKRFRTEAEAVALLDHPHIVSIHEVGEHAGQPFFTMRLIEGENLAAALNRFRSDPRRAAGLMATVGHAVHYAHQRGILHRDLKPANILLDARDQPHVTDFGLAKLLDRESHLTQSDMVIGTPHYMAPEQASGRTRTLTTSADIYSLGAIFYELLTGRPPFEGGSWLEVMQRTQTQEPVRPGVVEPAVDRDLETICLKCLEKDPARRYASAEALAEDLERWLRHEPIMARRASLTWRITKWVQRKPGLAASLTLLLVVGLLGLGGILTQWHRANEARRQAVELLRESYLAQARAQRFSDRPGRRFGSLDVLGKAAAIRPSVELRNEAIACLPLFDLNPGRRWDFRLDRELAAFDPALGRYAVADESGELTLRATADDVVVQRLPPPPGVSGPAQTRFSPDGQWLAVTFPGRGTVIWNLARAEQGPLADSDHVEFSADSERWVLARRLGGIEVRDLKSGRVLQRLGEGRRFHWPAFDASGQRVGAVQAPERRSLVLFDLRSGAETGRVESETMLHGFAWHPDGSRIASARYSASAISIWDCASLQEVQTLDLPQGAPVSLAFSHDGSLLASGGWDGAVRVWHLPSSQLMLTASGGGFVRFSPDDARLAVVSWPREAIWYFDVALGRELRSVHESIPPSEGGERVVFNRDGTVLAYTMGRQLKLVEARSGKPLAALTNQVVRNMIADPRDSGFLVTTEDRWYRWPIERSGDGSTLRAGSLEQIGPTGDYWISAATTNDSAILVQHGQDHYHIFDLQTYQSRVKMKEPHPGLRFHALSADGQWAASGAWHQRTVMIWDARSGDRVKTLELEGMSSVAFSPDNRWLVVGGKDFRFYRVGTWSLEREVARPPTESFPPAMTFSSDGSVLALCHTWQSVRLIDVSSGEEIATFEPPRNWNISMLSLNADGSLLAVSGSAPEIQLWDVRRIRGELRGMGLDW